MTKAIEHSPVINAVIDSEVKNVIYRDYVDIIVPVYDSDNTLVNVVMKDCQTKKYTDILKEYLLIEEKVKNQKLEIEETLGGTISIYNNDMSMMNMTAIENNTTVKIGINKINERPYCVNNNPNRIEPRKVAMVSCTYDHRLIDGKDGVLYLRRVKEYMENPLKMIFDL